MRAFLMCAISTALLISAGIPSPAFSKMKKAPSASPVPRSEAASEMDQALGEFKTAAERLGKSMGKAADENTADARLKIMKTMNGAIQELSHTMNRAAQKIESNSGDKK